MEDAAPALTAQELADRLGGSLEGPGDRIIRGVNALAEAGADDITFITTDAYAQQWASSRAGAAVVSEGVTLPKTGDAGRAVIRVKNAELALIELLERFAPPPPRVEPGVHPTAWIDPTATIDANASIGPHVSIGPRAAIGPNTVLHAGVRVYEDAVIGTGSTLHANVVIRERCRIGQRVILHQGVSIGADGFGYRPAPDGSGLKKMPHLGTVVIEDDVEVGANSCIDRGKFGATTIGRGTKIDNLVQIGHNCRIGRSCVIAALCAMGGSVTVGDGVQIGGAAAILDHITIGSGARLSGDCGVIHDVPANTSVAGLPAGEVRSTLRQWAAVRTLPDWQKKVNAALRERREP